MSFQKNDESDFDFSIIDHKAKQEGKLNFSVQSLLSEHQPSSKSKPVAVSQHENQSIKKQKFQYQNDQVHLKQEGNSFLKDLQKFEEQLSFETQIYNVYQQEIQRTNEQLYTKSYLHGKSNSHLKTTKENSNQLMKSFNNDQYGYLIIDFGMKKKQKMKQIQKLKNNKNTIKSPKTKILNSINNYSKQKQRNHKIFKENKSLVKITSKKKSKSTQNSIKTKNTISTPRNNVLKKFISPTKSSKKSNYNDSCSKYSKNNISSTTLEHSKDKKQSLKSLREPNPYSQYFGGQTLSNINKSYNKLSISSSSGSYKNIEITSPRAIQITSPRITKKQVKQTKGNLIKKGPTKSKQRLDINTSPSSKNQITKFKKIKI